MVTVNVAQLERRLRVLRRIVFDCYEQSEAKGQRCSRLIALCKQRLMPHWQQQHDEIERRRTDRIMRTWE